MITLSDSFVLYYQEIFFLGQHECSGTDLLTTSLICNDLYFISILTISKAVFGIQPETEICVLSWDYKLMHPKVQLPVLFKTHDHVTENGDSQFGIASLRVRISISWRNTLGKQMRKVQWNKQRSRDGACFHPPEQAQRPEPRGQGWLCRGFMGFSALAMTNFLTGCCPQNSFERQFLRFLVIYRKLAHRQSYSFSNSQLLFQFLWTLCLNCTTVYWK